MLDVIREAYGELNLPKYYCQRCRRPNYNVWQLPGRNLEDFTAKVRALGGGATSGCVGASPTNVPHRGLSGLQLGTIDGALWLVL